MVISPNNKSQVLFSLLLLLAVILLGMRIISINQRGIGKAFGWSARLTTDQVVTNIDTTSPAALAGVKVGDKIIGFNDLIGFESDVQKEKLVKAFRGADVDGTYTLMVRRGNETLKFDISSAYKGSYDLRYNIIQYHIIGVIFLSFGVGILLLKPYDSLSMIFSAFLMGLSACYIPVLSGRLPIVIGSLTDVIQYSCVFVTPYLLIHFFLLFPEPIKQEWLSRCVFLLYTLFIIHAVIYLIPKYIDLFSPLLYSRNQVLRGMATNAFNAFYLVFLAAIIIGLGLLYSRFYRTNSKKNKVKMSWVLLGIVIGLPPLLLLNGLGGIVGIKFSRESAMAAGLASLIFPLTFGYAIVKHRVIDIRWVLRLSVKYILVSRIVHAIESVIIVILLYYFLLPYVIGMERMEREDSLRTAVVISIVSYSIVLWMLGMVNERITRLLDRIYFREGHYAEALLIKLTRSMSNIKEQHSLYELVAEEIMNAIHIDKVAFFLPDKMQGTVATEFGSVTSTLSPVPRLIYFVSEYRPKGRPSDLKPAGEVDYGSWVTQINGGRETPIEICYEDQASWVHQLPTDVYHALREVNSNLLVPLAHNETVYGLISIGEKLSELPYTSNDVNLILSLVAQINIVLDRIMLIKEVSHQERLKKEIEIAQGVQARLFPQDPVSRAGLEVVGSCIPARMVGGDYYDYIESSDGKLGIAIGDVSGKGISGALIMSTLRSSLRSITLDENSKPSSIVYNLNNILCHSINPDKFVTFFYCVYDRTENTITYINAGHEPPIILRNPHRNNDYDIARGNSERASSITYADNNGLVLGILENYDYEQHIIHLSEGDIFVAYTDGITEARNVLEEEYGIDRLKTVVCRHSLLPVERLKSLILEDVRKFVGDREQQDDITLIVAKV
jgi:sigma-B regulation protein RsbU (phosphoserine phosphatase)